jgi:hypothetical protein
LYTTFLPHNKTHVSKKQENPKTQLYRLLSQLNI